MARKLKIKHQKEATTALPAILNLILIELPVMNAIEAVVHDHNGAVETGGLLLGYRKSEFFHVTANTTPQANDICKPFSFERKDPAHQHISTFNWIKSGFKCDWLGEWHSHPVAHPTPSIADIKTWNSQVKERNSAMCYVIIGTHSNWIGWLKPTETQPYQFSNVQYSNDSILAQ